MKDEKVYQFNEYILGYDEGLNDRSCLTISKIQNGNMYVMATLTDGSADVISLMLDNLQQENKQLKEELKEYKKCIDEQNEELYRIFNSLQKATTLNRVFENISTELEKYLTKITKNGADIEKLTCSNILVYLKELKEKYNLGDKENE